MFVAFIKDNSIVFSGLFENRHGWTVQLHDDNAVYEVAGSDYVLDLIGEIEVPPGVPHTVAPFLVSASTESVSKLKSSRLSRNRCLYAMYICVSRRRSTNTNLTFFNEIE